MRPLSGILAAGTTEALPLTVYPAVIAQSSPGELSQPLTAVSVLLSTADSYQQGFRCSFADFFRTMAPNIGDVNTISNQTQSKLFSVTEVEPWLYLSGASVLGARLLEDLSVSCVISACPELPSPPLPDCVVLHHQVDIKDTPNADIRPHLARVADIIAKVAEEGGRTLVHCVAGVSRSASLCLGYMVRVRGLTLEAAYLRLLDLRPCIRPNFGFFSQLIDFEKEHTGTTTVCLAYNKAAKALIPNVYEPEYVNTIRYIQRTAGNK